MKKILGAIIIFTLFGCGGHYTTSFDSTSNPRKSIYDGTAYGILPPPSPLEMSQSQINSSQADLIAAIADNIRGKNQKAADPELPKDFSLNPDLMTKSSEIKKDNATRYGVVVNNAKRPVWWQHPEAPAKLKIEPGGFLYLPLDQMPESIVVYQSNGDFRVFYPKYKPKKYGGVDTYFIWYIDRTSI